MFCYQCEQTANGTGCTVQGVCGKLPDVADLQDLLLHSLKGIGMYAHCMGKLGVNDDEINAFTLEGLFTTVTNVNFDTSLLQDILAEAGRLIDKVRKMYEGACKAAGKSPETLNGPAL